MTKKAIKLIDKEKKLHVKRCSKRKIAQKLEFKMPVSSVEGFQEHVNSQFASVSKIDKSYKENPSYGYFTCHEDHNEVTSPIGIRVLPPKKRYLFSYFGHNIEVLNSLIAHRIILAELPTRSNSRFIYSVFPPFNKSEDDENIFALNCKQRALSLFSVFPDFFPLVREIFLSEMEETPFLLGTVRDASSQEEFKYTLMNFEPLNCRAWPPNFEEMKKEIYQPDNESKNDFYFRIKNKFMKSLQEIKSQLIFYHSSYLDFAMVFQFEFKSLGLAIDNLDKIFDKIFLCEEESEFFHLIEILDKLFLH